MKQEWLKCDIHMHSQYLKKRDIGNIKLQI